jgi:hypothetical protein
MSLRAFDDKPGTVVRDVTQGGAAAQAGAKADDLVFQVCRNILCSGCVDSCLSPQVNDDDLSDALHADVLKAIAASGDTMLLGVRRPRTDALAPVVESQATASSHLAQSGKLVSFGITTG